MIRIFFTNLDYPSADSFRTVEEALVRAKRCGFDCGLWADNADGSTTFLGSWSILRGWRPEPSADDVSADDAFADEEYDANLKSYDRHHGIAN